VRFKTANAQTHRVLLILYCRADGARMG
jgi:hypothetical protein